MGRASNPICGNVRSILEFPTFVVSSCGTRGRRGDDSDEDLVPIEHGAYSTAERVGPAAGVQLHNDADRKNVVAGDNKRTLRRPPHFRNSKSRRLSMKP